LGAGACAAAVGAGGARAPSSARVEVGWDSEGWVGGGLSERGGARVGVVGVCGVAWWARRECGRWGGGGDGGGGWEGRTVFGREGGGG